MRCSRSIPAAMLTLAALVAWPAAAGDASPAALPKRVGRFVQRIPRHRDLPPGLPSTFRPVRVWLSEAGAVHLDDGRQVFRLDGGRFVAAARTADAAPASDASLMAVAGTAAIRRIAHRADGGAVAATESGLFERAPAGGWTRLAPIDTRGLTWALLDVRSVTHDAAGRLVVATPAGLLRRADRAWEFFTPSDGLPVIDFTVVTPGPDGSVWCGTRRGAIEWIDGAFRYRQGPRWLPGDVVHDAVVTPDGTVVLVTDGGVGWIESRSMTLTEKADYYEKVIERAITRTEHGFVATAAVDPPGDVTAARPVASDNDGLWTAMYGAAQCFAYGRDRHPDAKRRADRALRALAFLQAVPQGGDHPPPPGFPARTVVPTDGPDPNTGQEERDRAIRAHDPHWKSLAPRWPTSADGRWWWKADTSSDELDGQFFFLALYHDLVAETDAERASVRTAVAGIADHLLTHGFRLVDHDGAVTRWGEFSPAALNHDRRWLVERGLNSMSLLAYLTIAEHVTADRRYAAAAEALRRDHAYDANALLPKVQHGIGSGNQSDDEMAFMNLYHLVRLTRDPGLQQAYLAAFHRAWLLECPERNPFFHMAFAATARAVGRGGPLDPTSPAHHGDADWLDDTIASLVWLPLDRCQWRHVNSHRLDVVRLPAAQSIDPGVPDPVPRGYRIDGKVVPVDERSFAHWNTDPWRLDDGGDGRELASGTVFLLPWHMARYHGLLAGDD